MRAVIGAIFLACMPLVAAAEVSPLQALVTADDTRGWEAVGRIDIGTSSFCTGALISPSIVLTAAHCLYDQDSGTIVDASDFTFLAGWRGGRAAAYRGVKRAVAHPDYVYEGRDRIDRVAYDLAFLELDQPIRLPSIQPFMIGYDPQQGDSVGIVSYGLDRSEAPSLEESCEVLGRQPGILVMTCSVEFGSSGAPIFAMVDGVPQIVSVVSAKAEMDGQNVALGTAMQIPLSELREAFAATERAFRKVAPGFGAAAASVGAGSSGAKFLKP
ncbi:MAG: trypsin-like serine protease [Albidovulum sp.]